MSTAGQKPRASFARPAGRAPPGRPSRSTRCPGGVQGLQLVQGCGNLSRFDGFPLGSRDSGPPARLLERKAALFARRAEEVAKELMKNVDRARAVRKIHQDGTSLRALAKNLNCSPTLLRHLNLAAQAPNSDQLLARQRKINTRELARRGKTAADLDASKQRGALECERMQEVQKISKAICEWLETEGLSRGHGEQIVDEARRLLADAEATHHLPRQDPAPSGTPVQTIIDRLRPPRPAHDGTVPSAWYAEWLVRWVFFALPDSSTRHQALSRALDAQIRAITRGLP